MMCQDIYGISQKTAIEKLFDKQNMNLEDIKPMWFDSFMCHFYQKKYKTGKMNFISGFLLVLYQMYRVSLKRVFIAYLCLKNK